MRSKKRHHSTKGFHMTNKLENGMFAYTQKDKNVRAVDVLMMNWMQQRELIKFVKTLEFLNKILKSVQHQLNHIK